MRMVNISNEKSMQSYTARCSRYKNKYTNLVCGKTAVGRNYNLPRDRVNSQCKKTEIAKKSDPLDLKLRWVRFKRKSGSILLDNQQEVS